MFLNSFSVRVSQGTEKDGGYVELPHNTQYSLTLANKRSTRCDCRVEIDGKHVGTWRINAYASIIIERPAHDDGMFTFYKLNSQEAIDSGLVKGDPNLGLIKATFTPEAIRQPQSIEDVLRGSRGSFDVGGGFTKGGATTRGFSAGGTGLSGQSSQQFSQADAITPDYSQQTVIHLRLVAPAEPSKPRPLTAYSTPVPPPVA